jgi:hypothetical protein
MEQRNKTVTIAVVVIFIISLVLVGIFILRLQLLKSSTKVNISTTNNQSNVEFQIESRIPGFQIKQDSFNKNALTTSLNKLGLYPFENLLYVGEPINGVWHKDSRRINPKELDVILYPYSQLGKDMLDRAIMTLTDDNQSPTVTILSGQLNSDGKFNLPIYINESQLEEDRESASSFLSEQVLMGIYSNFQQGPLSSTTNYYQILEDKIGRTDDLFKLN